MKNLEEIKDILIKALESLEHPEDGGEEYVCHEDVPEYTPSCNFCGDFDTHFTAFGEEGDPVFLVCIKQVNL